MPLALADLAPQPGKLRLLSPASAWTLNDSYGNDPIVRLRLGALSITLNPVDAAARELGPGMLARITSESGQLVLPVEVSDDVPPAVAFVPKGRWPKLEPSGSNVNVLNPGQKADMGESSSVHGTEVTVEALEPTGASHEPLRRDAV